MFYYCVTLICVYEFWICHNMNSVCCRELNSAVKLDSIFTTVDALSKFHKKTQCEHGATFCQPATELLILTAKRNNIYSKSLDCIHFTQLQAMYSVFMSEKYLRLVLLLSLSDVTVLTFSSKNIQQVSYSHCVRHQAGNLVLTKGQWCCARGLVYHLQHATFSS